jgi:hypothetical protein
METRIYATPGLTADALAEFIRQWFAEQEYETQIFRNPDHSLIVQGYRDDLWRVAFGLAVALTVEIRPVEPDSLEISVGAGAWGDKLIVAGVGLLLFFPLVLAAAWGSWQQYSLDQKVWDVIIEHLPKDSTFTTVASEPIPLPDQWFDEGSGTIYAVKFFSRMDSWRQAMADGLIEPIEVYTQAEKVTEMMRTVEPSLSDEAHAKLTEALREMAVLQGMQSYALLHPEK